MKCGTSVMLSPRLNDSIEVDEDESEDEQAKEDRKFLG